MAISAAQKRRETVKGILSTMVHKRKGQKMKVAGGKQMKYINGHHDIFEIVDSVDSSYRVWNIGEYMGRSDLIPLCQMEDPIKIGRGTLKAVRLSECEVRILRDAACYGVSSLQEAREALESERGGWLTALQVIRKDLARKSLPVFERIYKEGRQ